MLMDLVQKEQLSIYIPINNMKIVFGGKLISTTITLSDGTNKTISATLTGYIIASKSYTLSKGLHTMYITWKATTYVSFEMVN